MSTPGNPVAKQLGETYGTYYPNGASVRALRVEEGFDQYRALVDFCSDAGVSTSFHDGRAYLTGSALGLVNSAEAAAGDWVVKDYDARIGQKTISVFEDARFRELYHPDEETRKLEMGAISPGGLTGGPTEVTLPPEEREALTPLDIQGEKLYHPSGALREGLLSNLPTTCPECGREATEVIAARGRIRITCGTCRCEWSTLDPALHSTPPPATDAEQEPEADLPRLITAATRLIERWLDEGESERTAGTLAEFRRIVANGGRVVQ